MNLILFLVSSVASAATGYEAITSPTLLADTCSPKLEEQAFPSRTKLPYGTPIKLVGGHFSKEGLESTLEKSEEFLFGSDSLRVVSIFTTNLKGSGSWNQVYVLRCKHGKLDVVLEAAAEGLKYSFKKPATINLRYPGWKLGDSHASPSRSLGERFVWIPKEGLFWH